MILPKETRDSNQRMRSAQMPVTRRQFLKRLGVLSGGLVVYIAFGDPQTWAQAPNDFNAFLKIGADGRVACFTGKVEIGQGAITALSQTIADELDVPYDSVDMVMGDTDLCPWDRGTHGSRTIRYFVPLLREAAAEARAVLIELASENLKTPIPQLIVKDGIIYDKTKRENQITYAELTKGKLIEKHLKQKPPIKATAELRLMGKSFLSRDTLEKVTGKAKYAGDIRLSGMLYAKILRPPAHGAKLKHVDTSEAKKTRDVIVIEDNELISVLHQHPDEAEKALEKINVEYDLPDTKIDDQTIFKHLVDVAPEGDVVSQGGVLQTGKKQATDVFSKKYLNSYVAHAPMETHTTVAEVKQDQATIWASTQRPFGIKEEVAAALGFNSENVRVITPFVGGGFGGKNFNQEAVEAARLAKLTGKPVQVAWSRGEEFFYDSFRPAAVVTITSGIDSAGSIVLWDYEVFFAGSDGSKQFYDIPHHKEVSRGHWHGSPGSHPFRTGPWRAPGNNTNTFAREAQIDIMASKIEVDPFQFRLNHLSDKKMRRVLQVAADKFNWAPSKTPSGRGVGVACSIRSGSYVATMAKVAVDQKSGQVQVKRVVCVQDMGFSVNPEGAKLQMEGCVTMGLGYALREEIRFKDGKIFDLNFDTYEIPRFSWLPKIETAIVEDTDSPPQGGGEPPIVCMGAVIANAIFDATGARLYQLPMTPARVKEALAKI
jgi:isoquinoline 1-oxidoreductase